MKAFKKLLMKLVALIAFGVFLGFLLSAYEKGKKEHEESSRKEAAEMLFQQQKGSILWDGYNGKSFDVKITSYCKNRNMFFTGEEILTDISWAKMELWPTIGSLPTLLYMDSNNPGQVKRIACSAAEII